MQEGPFIINPNDLILVTGASGFMGPRLVRALLERGVRNLRCFVRPSAPRERVRALVEMAVDGARIEVIEGNLLVRRDCAAAVEGAAVIFHLAAGRGQKSFPDAFANSAIITRNVLEALGPCGPVKRFVNVSSFTVYTNSTKERRRILDETCAVEQRPVLRGDAYCFAKVKQEQILAEYSRRFGIPYVNVRPGHVYGAGNEAISGRVGTDIFGVFLNLGGANPIPLTYVDNCADAIALAGLKPDIDGDVFNVVDDDLPSSRRFLRLYKRHVRRFRSIYVPGFLSYGLCALWEWYSWWSNGQLPPVFNRRKWHANWKKTKYSNAKLKDRLGWVPKVSTAEGLMRYFEACRNGANRA